MSETYYKEHDADKGVDGDSKTKVFGRFWWSVDLGRPFVLTGIRITTARSLRKCWYYFNLVIMFHKHV